MASRKIISLSDDDIRLLQRLLDLAKLSSPDLRSALDGLWAQGEDQSAPEVYVAKPTDGETIPGLTAAAGWTGTGTGTGTAPECDQYDSPGSAECRIYEIVDTEGCGPALMEVEDHDKTVYNVGEAAIDPGEGYLAIERDKFGKWLALAGGGAGIVGFCCGAFSQGSSVSATATWTAGGASAAVGDTITVSDPCGEYYNTSGAACGAAVKVGASWYMLRCTCYNFTASCSPPATGT